MVDIIYLFIGLVVYGAFIAITGKLIEFILNISVEDSGIFCVIWPIVFPLLLGVGIVMIISKVCKNLYARYEERKHLKMNYSSNNPYR